MILGEAVFWIVGLMLLGIIGFFVMAVALVFRFLAFVFRSLFGTDNAREVSAAAPRPLPRICEDASCGHVNPPQAQYCGRCGRTLLHPRDVDAYG